MSNKETRVFKSELRSLPVGEGKKAVRGYAALFNSESEDLGGFVEIIEPGFFSNVMNDDVRALKNHNDDWVLGRTTSGTLRINEDERGLYYEYDDPDTTYSNDLLKSIDRGDITQSSFGFAVKKGGEEVRKEERGGKTIYIRTLKSGGAERLYDISPVTFPAYPDTEVALRSLKAVEQSNDKITTIKNEQDRLARALRISQLKMQMQKQ